MIGTIPVAVFAHRRTHLLQQLLDCLRRDHVPLLYLFCDAPRTAPEAEQTDAVRRIARAVDWCDVRLLEQPKNLGLGRSILSGVTSVLQEHAAAIVFEDDLTCSAGTYRYFCEALTHYQHESPVMSVTGWTHPRVRPASQDASPYLDGRAESWSFATWRRAWRGMDQSAVAKYAACRLQHIDVYRYGSDLVGMARQEQQRNLWAVRWAYHHILNRGLCLRPGKSLVNHMGTDALATNAPNTEQWLNAELTEYAEQSPRWPAPREAPGCAELWQATSGQRPALLRRYVNDARLLWSAVQAAPSRRTSP